MTAVNTHRTLNDYRMSTEPAYESRSLSKFGAGALVIAIFLGIGAYFYYSTPHGNAHANPASGDMNYQAPAATPSAATPGSGAAPADTMDHAALPDAPNATAPAPATPSTDANAAHTSAPEPAMNRTATENKANVAPAQSAQRTKQSTKSPTKSISETTPASTGNAAAAAPEMTTPTPTVSPQPATADPTTHMAQDPTASKSDASAEVVSGAATDDTTGG